MERPEPVGVRRPGSEGLAQPGPFGAHEGRLDRHPDARAGDPVDEVVGGGGGVLQAQAGGVGAVVGEVVQQVEGGVDGCVADGVQGQPAPEVEGGPGESPVPLGDQSEDALARPHRGGTAPVRTVGEELDPGEPEPVATGGLEIAGGPFERGGVGGGHVDVEGEGELVGHRQDRGELVAPATERAVGRGDDRPEPRQPLALQVAEGGDEVLAHVRRRGQGRRHQGDGLLAQDPGRHAVGGAVERPAGRVGGVGADPGGVEGGGVGHGDVPADPVDEDRAGNGVEVGPGREAVLGESVLVESGADHHPVGDRPGQRCHHPGEVTGVVEVDAGPSRGEPDRVQVGVHETGHDGRPGVAVLDDARAGQLVSVADRDDDPPVDEDGIPDAPVVGDDRFGGHQHRCHVRSHLALRTWYSVLDTRYAARRAAINPTVRRRPTARRRRAPARSPGWGSRRSRRRWSRRPRGRWT